MCASSTPFSFAKDVRASRCAFPFFGAHQSPQSEWVFSFSRVFHVHIPHKLPQRFLDLCDENGILIWSETLGPSVKTSDLTSPYWLEYQIQAVNEMIDAAINNPSIILWALLSVAFSSFFCFSV